MAALSIVAVVMCSWFKHHMDGDVAVPPVVFTILDFHHPMILKRFTNSSAHRTPKFVAGDLLTPKASQQISISLYVACYSTWNSPSAERAAPLPPCESWTVDANSGSSAHTLSEVRTPLAWPFFQIRWNKLFIAIGRSVAVSKLYHHDRVCDWVVTPLHAKSNRIFGFTTMIVAAQVQVKVLPKLECLINLRPADYLASCWFPCPCVMSFQDTGTYCKDPLLWALKSLNLSCTHQFNFSYLFYAFLLSD